MDRMKLFCHGVVLSYITYIASSSQQPDRHDDCTQTGISLTCNHDIPDHVPHGVTDIFINDFDKPWPEHSHVLHDQSWTSVTKFDIIINPKGSWDLSGTNFQSNLDRLKNLKTLGIHGSNIYIGTNSFKGLDNVTHLNLANCQSLTVDDIVRILSRNQTLPNLKYLNLAMLKAEHGNFLILSKSFMDLLHAKSIEMLSLSGTNVVINDLKQLQRNFSLEYLDISNITLAVTDILNSEIVSLRSFLANVKTLNISNISNRYIQLQHDFQNLNYTTHCKNSPFSANLEHLFANNMNEKKIIFDNSSVTVSPRCKLKQVKTLHLRGNSLRKLNGTIYWPQDIETDEIDLSSNGMVYLSPKIFGGIVVLRKFYIANNSLFEMESLKEFSNLLRAFFLLEHINMAYNKLTIIPYGMFINNERLKLLNLMGNRLQSITFKLEHLEQLKVLDLRQNEILYLKGEGLLQIQSLVHPEKNENSSKIDIRFKGNPLKCSCESLEFIKWLYIYLHTQPHTHMVYQCQLEDDVTDLDTAAVEKSNYLCHRDGIISAISVSIIIVALIITGSIAVKIYRVRKRKQTGEIQKFLDNFKKGLLEEKYLVFLSHSSDDGDFVMGYVFNQLDNTLKHMVEPGFDKEIICTGDIHFRPGVSLINEIMRCVSESLVMIFVISRSFCQSAWCRMELKEAYQQEKPIILIFKEQVNLDIMPQYLRNIFQRYARAKLVHVNGQIAVIPGWKTLCNSVIFLASRKQLTTDAENKL